MLGMHVWYLSTVTLDQLGEPRQVNALGMVGSWSSAILYMEVVFDNKTHSQTTQIQNKLQFFCFQKNLCWIGASTANILIHSFSLLTPYSQLIGVWNKRKYFLLFRSKTWSTRLLSTINKQLYYSRKWQSSKSLFAYCVYIFVKNIKCHWFFSFFLLMHYIATIILYIGKSLG